MGFASQQTSQRGAQYPSAFSCPTGEQALRQVRPKPGRQGRNAD